MRERRLGRILRHGDADDASGRSSSQGEQKPNFKAAIEAGEGILRLAPCWVPRSFLDAGQAAQARTPRTSTPSAPIAAASTSAGSPPPPPAANDNARRDEGLSYVVHDGERFTLARGRRGRRPASSSAQTIWDKYKRWPVYSKFFDNMGPIPHHMHQSDEQAALVGQEGKPECYYFPPQLNSVGNNFPYTFMGLEPGTTKADVRRCLENWNKGDNGILDLSKAYRLKPGTGWLVPALRPARPRLALHLRAAVGLATSSACTSRMVEGRARALGAAGQGHAPRQAPAGPRLHRRAARLGSQRRSQLQGPPLPRADRRRRDRRRLQDRWVDKAGSSTARSNGEQLFTAKELTVEPGAKVTIKDNGAYGLITVQGTAAIGKHALQTPEHDPLRRDDRGRGLRHPRGRHAAA